MVLKRNRIKELIKQGKIRVDLNNLISLLNGNFLQRTGDMRNEKYFKFSTPYGEICIHLDALFIDYELQESIKIPEDLNVIPEVTTITERDVEIWIFMNDVSQEIVNSAKLGLSFSDLILSQRIAETLYSEYLNSFEDRIDLSEYTCRKEALNERERARYEELKSELYFSVVDDKIAENMEVSIIGYKNKYSPAIIRLAILYVITNASIELSRLSKKSGGKAEYRELDEQEIYYLLNPIVNTSRKYNLILPIHFENYTLIRAALSDFGVTITRVWENSHPKTKASLFFDFGSWISPGEKLIIKSFFNSVESFYPSFLK